MKISSLTDIGTTREMNQDYLYSSEEAVGNLPNLFLVADGMGGHKAGEFASRFAVGSCCCGHQRESGEAPGGNPFPEYSESKPQTEGICR